MNLTATLASTAPTDLRRRVGTPPQVLGGEAWVVPFEPGGYPWLTVSTPQIFVTDRRPVGRRDV